MKQIKISAFFLLLAVMLVGCKDERKEWNYLYGYTNEDIIGAYHFSNVTDAFDSLIESEYCFLCDDAEITISPYMENRIEFVVKCPDENFHHVFQGMPTYNENECLISMTDNYYSVSAFVYTNAKGQIRLHGFARYGIPAPAENPSAVTTCYNYYFDVIKN